MSDPVTWTLDADIKDGKLDTLVGLLAGAIETVEGSEPTTLAYEFFVSEDQRTLLAMERYSDSEAALVHLRTMGPKLEPLMECLERAPTVRVHGDASAELRSALTGFAPTYFRAVGGFRR